MTDCSYCLCSTVLAKDFQTVTLYDSTGKFAGVRRVESKTPIVVEGMEIVIDRIIGSTGLEVKSDPGVPLVYAGKLFRAQKLQSYGILRYFKYIVTREGNLRIVVSG